jgi:hypothetical protein
VKQKFNNSRLLKIFSSLKNIESDYPAGLMRKRRRNYVRQLAQIAKQGTAGRQKSAFR